MATKAATKPAAAADADTTKGIFLDAIMKTPNGTNCQQQGDRPGELKDLSLSNYIYMLLTQPRDTTSMAESLKRAVLAHRVDTAEDRFMRFNVNEKKMILDCMEGQPPSLVYGAVQLIDPEQIERLK